LLKGLFIVHGDATCAMLACYLISDSLFEAPGSSMEMTMEQIVQGNYEKQEQQ
jgi:hypothetical protein